MANTFYIVRHGETNWNILGKTQGHGNSNLTEKGIEQATTLAESMSKYPIDYIYSSDLGRAVETANILADVIIPISAIVDKFLKKGGIFISSGIIYMKEEDVVDAIKKNHKLKFMETVNQGDWRAIMAQKISD